MNRRRRILLIVGLIGCGVALYALRDRWAPSVARHLDVGGPPIKADYGLILAGDVQSRPFGAAILYRYGYVRKLLLTRPPLHGDSPMATDDFTELAIRILVKEGVLRDDIQLLEGDVHSTLDEARLLAPLVRAEPLARFVVITNDYHTRRGRWSVQYSVPEAADRITAFATPTMGIQANNWWQTQNGVRTYCGEYARLGFYYFRYGSAGYYAAALLVAVVLIRFRRRPAAQRGS